MLSNVTACSGCVGRGDDIVFGVPFVIRDNIGVVNVLSLLIEVD